MSADRRFPLARSALRSDFGSIVEEVQLRNELAAVVVLIDEANLLAASMATLQAIRNLLMDTPGLMFRTSRN